MQTVEEPETASMTSKPALPEERLIVALDHNDAAPALALAKELQGAVRMLKIGSILYTACGPEVVKAVRGMGFEVMLDLKFHDIPSTVELSCRSAVRHGISLLTVHAGGGVPMLAAALKGLKAEAQRLEVPRPRVVAVTVLTSVAAEQPRRLQNEVLRLAQDAVDAHCDGLVSSALEAPPLRRKFGEDLLLVCPGIRSAHRKAHDQKRTCTPSEAIARGADYIVVGRPITEAEDPRAAALEMLDAMGEKC